MLDVVFGGFDVECGLRLEEERPPGELGEVEGGGRRECFYCLILHCEVFLYCRRLDWLYGDSVVGIGLISRIKKSRIGIAGGC